jgi:hypothetical protein
MRTTGGDPLTGAQLPGFADGLDAWRDRQELRFVSAARTVVFLSHTSELGELPTKRSFVAAAEAACIRAGFAFTDMAYFTARDTSPAQHCIDEVSSADVYVGIIGFRYGSPVRDRPDVSYTELEFEVATEHGLRRLIFMLDESADLPPGAVRDLEHGVRQEQFRQHLMEAGLTVAMVNTPEELEIGLLHALTERQDGRSSRGGPLSIELKQMAEAKRRLQQSVELALEVGRLLEPDQVMDRIMVRLTTSMEADQATLLRMEGQDLVAEATYRRGAGREVPTCRGFPPGLVERIPALARSLATGAPAVGGRLEAAPGAEELVQTLPTGVHTLLLPYAVEGRICRVFVLGRDEDRPFEHADIADLVPLADVAMLALDNAGRRAAVEGAARVASSHSGHLAEAIVEAVEEIGSAEQLQDMVERARLLAVLVLRAERGNISRLEGDELVVERDHRPALPYSRRRPLSRSRMTAEAIRTRRPVHGPVAEGAVGPDGIAWMVPAGLRYAMSCPMIVSGEVVGVFGLGRSRDEPFTDADGEALLPFAKLVGLLLRNARRLAEVRQIGQAKSQLMALAAHELRTPLAVIRDHLSLLEDGSYPVPDRTRAEVVETLVSKAQELESLVDSLVMAAGLGGRNLPPTYGASLPGPAPAE